MAAKLTQSFFNRPTLTVAPKLLGAKLATCRNGVCTSGMIVEVEAYRGDIDQAAHSYGPRTPRNEVMFLEGGRCYVYFIYGMHHCVNVVTEPEGSGAAVLIRALEPIEGIEIMKRRRGVKNLRELTNGPGKICQALGIDKKMLGQHFLSSTAIRLESYRRIPGAMIGQSTRIGISKSKHLPWRFYIKGNAWVSRKSGYP